MGSASEYDWALPVQRLETIAASHPDRIYAEYPKANWEEDGFAKVSWKQMKEMVDKVVSWLDKTLGRAEDVDKFAYRGANDLRYAILVFAAIKCGRTMVIPDGIISGEALSNLLDQTGCNVWLGSDERIAEVASIAKLRPGLKSYPFPSLQYWLESPAVEHYPYSKSTEEAKLDPMYIIHTSGTTGTPKQIVHTNLFASNWERERRTVLGPGGNKLQLKELFGSRLFAALPPQWFAGLSVILHMPLYFDVVPILIPPTAFPRLDLQQFQEIHRKVHFGGALMTPAVLDALTLHPPTLEILKSLKYVAFCGSALDQRVGDALCKETQLLSFLGSTEGTSLPLYKHEDPADWNFYHFHPSSGYRMDPVEGSNVLYEMVMVRDKTLQLPQQNVFFAYPDLDEYHTKDLWSPHHKQNLWTNQGRLNAPATTLDTAKGQLYASLVGKKMAESPLGRPLTLGAC